MLHKVVAYDNAIYWEKIHHFIGQTLAKVGSRLDIGKTVQIFAVVSQKPHPQADIIQELSLDQ